MATSSTIVPDPSPASGRSRASPPGPANERVVRLLGQYPHISHSEAGEILRFVRTARYTEVARLTADETVRRQLDEFIRTNRHAISTGPRDLLAMAALLIPFVAICLLLWNQVG